jgi:hypothetical protein
MLPLVFQSSSSFDGMASKAKVTYVNDAFGLADTMSVGDLFTKKAKKNSQKVGDLPKETGTKKARMTSAEEATFARPSPATVAYHDISGSQLHGKPRFYTEYIRLSDNLAHRQPGSQATEFVLRITMICRCI